ncbi:hypothetical protein [Paenibacillus sp. L3-i20]|uniref:hypothetical protein n=1 Tax=Paenibacillus sp. L3-i20 TaxID=2905833 RepID=UPI001EDDEC6E|nr:hypothetical protein [Paenibacillus sp. L3-i20]GKU76187.1 hypothetical protein L3i20_v205840 [Paenibacillus sp. L3-i20]
MAYVGLYGGLIFAFFGWYFGRRAAIKNNALDEVHRYIWSKARSTSWFCTLAAIYIMLMLGASGIQIEMMPALSILLAVLLSSWGISGAFYSIRMTSEPLQSHSNPKLHLKLSLYFGLFILLIFTIISIVTGDWKFLLAAIPPFLLNLAITFIIVRRTSVK